MRPASNLRAVLAHLGPPGSAWGWAVGAALLVVALQLAGALAPLERAWFDQAASSSARFAVRDVALIEIDDASVAKHGPWPWPRDLLARVVERVGVAGARSILIVDDLSGPPESAALAQAISRNGRTLLALRLPPMVAAEAGATPSTSAGADRAPLPSFAAGAIAVGHVDWLVDGDGVARRAVLVGQREGFPEPALALMAAARQRDPELKGTPVVDGRLLRLGSQQMRLDADGALAPRWAARGVVPAGSRESALALLGGQLAAARYAGKVVLIGPTLAGAPQVATPARDAVPLVEAVAQLVSALLSGQVMQTPRGAGLLAALLALAGALGVVALGERYSAPSSWAWVIAAAVMALAASSLLAQLSSWWLPLLMPALAWLAAQAALQWARHRAAAVAVPASTDPPAAAALGVGTGSRRDAPPPAAAASPAEVDAAGFATTVVDPQAASASAMFGRYPLLREAARGPLGSIYLARDPQTRYPVAIKTMALAAHFGGEALSAVRRELERSSEAAAALRHPDIAATLDCGEDGGIDFVVCEWLEGEDLGRLYRAGAMQSVTGLLRTVARVAKAVAYAHRQGVVHGALRPSQVMVDVSTHRIMLVGLAAAPVVRRVALHTGVGSTLAYLAPELAAGGASARRAAAAVGPAADVWGLAALLHHGLTGRAPTRGRTGAIELDGLRPDLPDALGVLLAQGLDLRPQDRPRDALAFAEAVQAVLEAMGGAVSRPQVLPDVN